MISRKLHASFPQILSFSICLLQFLQWVVFKIEDCDWGWRLGETVEMALVGENQVGPRGDFLSLRWDINILPVPTG